jgi:hypothetical protein
VRGYAALLNGPSGWRMARRYFPIPLLTSGRQKTIFPQETPMSFDRLVHIDRLKEAGIDEAVARAHADALREALIETVATKQDLNEAISTVRTDLKDVITTLDRKIDTVRAELALSAQDLTIRGAGGLVIIASIIISLKLFG